MPKLKTDSQKIIRIQDSTLAKTIPERLSFLRSVLRLSREELVAEYNIPKTTLLSWENGIKNISDPNLHRLLDVYLQEGLIATAEWVKTGEGPAPYWSKEAELGRMHDTPEPLLTTMPETDDLLFAQEAMFFRSLSQQSVTFMLNSDDMAPQYHKGDMVGGRFKSGQELENLLNQACIVRLRDGRDCVRILTRAEKSNCFNLICSNPAAANKDFPAVMPEIEIMKAAKIIWVRSRD